MSESCHNNLPMRDNVSYRVNNSMETCPPQLQPVQQADSDEQLIQLWLHGRSQHTQRAYRKDIIDFLKYVDTPLRNITLGQLQGYTDDLYRKSLSPASIKRKIASVKSLSTFSHKIGYLIFDVGKPLKTPPCKDKLAERILSEEEVQTIINSAKNKRNILIIKTLYYTGIRVSELASLKWTDYQLKLTTDKPAFFVVLETPGIKGVFSDNSFTLIPQETKLVTFKPIEYRSHVKLDSVLKVTHLRDSYH